MVQIKLELELYIVYAEIFVFHQYMFSQLLPCGHPVIKDTRAAITDKIQPSGESYRGLTENDARYCELSLLRTPNYVPMVFAITRVDCEYDTFLYLIYFG